MKIYKYVGYKSMTCYFFLIKADNVVHRMELVKFQHSIQIFTNNLAENSTNQICFSIREKLFFFWSFLKVHYLIWTVHCLMMFTEVTIMTGQRVHNEHKIMYMYIVQ
jgi:hypothetical protein